MVKVKVRQNLKNMSVVILHINVGISCVILTLGKCMKNDAWRMLGKCCIISTIGDIAHFQYYLFFFYYKLLIRAIYPSF